MSAMSRRIDFEDEALVVRFDGLAAFTTLTRKVRIPYTAVGSVSIGLTDPPGLLAVKIGLSTPRSGRPSAAASASTAGGRSSTWTTASAPSCSTSPGTSIAASS